jgi:hypothetical protein
VIDRVRRGETLEPPLLVGVPGQDRLVIVEGHHRLISCLRRPELVRFPDRC